MHPPPFGKISLEGLLSRAQTIFTTGYKFQGELNLANLQQTFEVIADAIGKLSQQLEFRSQSDFGWISSRNLIGQRFHVISADNLDQEVKELSARAFQVRALSNNYPINMTVIHSSNQATADQFVIVLQCAHEYIDARSSELIFKLMVDYYNALARSDAAAMELVVAEARQLRTISTPEMVRLLVSVGYNPMANVKELESYPSSDIGEYRIPMESFPELIARLPQRERMPTGFFVDAKPMIARCRAANPKTSKIAIFAAVLHKALYNINVKYKGKPDKHLICGRMVSDIVTPALRQRFIGNYFSFVPVATPGELPVEEIARLIHDRIVEFKAKQLDVTCFQMVEFAASQNMLGRTDMEYSYTMTNWCNHHFLSTRQLLAGCDSLAHLSVANYLPLDALGATQVNRAIVGTNLSFDDVAYFSMMQSLRDDRENALIEQEVAELFRQA